MQKVAKTKFARCDTIRNVHFLLIVHVVLACSLGAMTLVYTYQPTTTSPTLAHAAPTTLTTNQAMAPSSKPTFLFDFLLIFIAAGMWYVDPKGRFGLVIAFIVAAWFIHFT